jgi:hypothetical protein
MARSESKELAGVAIVTELKAVIEKSEVKMEVRMVSVSVTSNASKADISSSREDHSRKNVASVTTDLRHGRWQDDGVHHNGAKHRCQMNTSIRLMGAEDDPLQFNSGTMSPINQPMLVYLQALESRAVGLPLMPSKSLSTQRR